MRRLIYADEAKENACKWECGGDHSCPYSKSNGIAHEQCEFMRAIDECRTIDAVPVVHGHWITDEDGDAYCSVCGDRWGGNILFKYCPNCGALMDDSTQSNDSNTLDALGEKVTE